MKTNIKQNIKNTLTNGRAKLALLGASVAASAPAFGAAADPSSVVTTATTAFEAVTTLTVAMVAFFIVVRIVKGIRK